MCIRDRHNTARVAKSPVSDEVLTRLAQPGATFADISELVRGDKGAEVLKTGDLTQGIYWASMAQGLIHDIPTVRELIDRIIGEAEAIINDRLRSALTA